MTQLVCPPARDGASVDLRAAGGRTGNQAEGHYSLAAIFAANSPATFSISPGVPINAGKSFTRR